MTVHDLRTPIGAAETDLHSQARRAGSAPLWASVGLIASVLAAEVWIRWIGSSTEFRPAPVLGPDTYSAGRLVALRVVEAVSVLAIVSISWLALVRPLVRRERVGTYGYLLVACLVGSLVDGLLDVYTYLFAWNAHSVNLGSWSKFMPIRSTTAKTRYAEALLWGIPMYVYFCLGVAIAGVALIQRLRRRNPAISNARALTYVFLAACVFDFVVENAIIHGTQAYAFATTPSGLTLWAGKTYQFPVYETVCVAILGVFFAHLKLSELDSPDGIPWIERGLERFRSSWQPAMRALVHIGFTMTLLIVVYHIPVNWLGTNGDSVAHLPSYLRPGG